jgi:hypothetical protein
VRAALEVAGEPRADQTLSDRRGAGTATVLAMRPYLFVVLEADRPLAGGARFALDGIDEVVIGRGPERVALREWAPGVRRLTLRLPGRFLSHQHARLRRDPQAGWLVEDLSSTNGTHLNGRPVSAGALGPGDVVEVGHTFLVVRPIPQPPDEASSDLDGRALASRPPGFATLVPPLADRLTELERIGRSEISVVLWGETGTGKEVLARGLHAISGRRGPLVAVNCGALTHTLAESQLFGHRRGAFSGAVADAPGLVRAADRGTLLLDEVGDLRPGTQAALLRVLQEREVTPVGAVQSHRVDVRFIATCPVPLETLVEEGRFRRDLLARLSGFVHPTTPLRSRREDLGLLLSALLGKLGISSADDPTLSPEAGLHLLRHPFALNVRELEQSLLRGWTLARGGVIALEPLVAGPRSAVPEAAPPVPVLCPRDIELRRRLVEVLTASKGNVAQAARQLGKARMQLHRWMKRLRIDPDTFRG